MNPEGIRFFNACKFKMMYKGPVGLLEKWKFGAKGTT
jgi:hypothetical protein